jgi:malate dehydrogenase (oxaloacetate-decarboxylating)(NADP+)
MKIPIMHDDQHGTAIITGAALLNALELVNKKIDEVLVVVNGAGASAISCTNLFVALGVSKQNIVMLDSKGVIRKDNPNLDATKLQFATNRGLYTLEDAVRGADVFLGLSKGNVLSPEMLLSMAQNPIVFACANPTPEIAYDLAMATRPDVLMATGRSDHPNQVNNVLGFPYIFRGALDVRATEINEDMKLASVKAIADLAKEPVPDIVNKAYGDKVLTFGREYFIPKPLDPRLITTISPAVAQAAMDSGVAKYPITDWEAYKIELQERLGIDSRFASRMGQMAKRHPKRVIFGEANNPKILKAAQIVKDEGIAFPILLGEKERILALIAENKLELSDCPIINPAEEKDKVEQYAQILYDKRKRKGLSLYEAKKNMLNRSYFGTMMLNQGEADAFISGLTKNYAAVIKPALEVVGVRPEVEVVAGMYVIISGSRTLFFADTTVNIDPTVDELVNIISLTKDEVRSLGFTPRIAVLSYSNFGSSKGDIPSKTAQAVQKAKKLFPDLIIDGDMQANIALNTELLQENYPFSELAAEGANTLIFPNLAAGNIAYKIVQELGLAETIGPILLGMNKPVHVLQLGSSVREIVDMVTLAVVDAQGVG